MLFKMDKTENIIFSLGLLLFITFTVMLFISLMFKYELSYKIIGVILASIVGGRMAAILAGFEVKLSSLYIILLLSVFNSIWLFVMFPLISTFYHKVIEVNFFGKMLHLTKKAAESQKDNVSRLGVWGLPVFIWLPFPWTGALVGSAIGFLLGLSTMKVMAIAVISMLFGVISWTIGFKYMVYFTGPAGKMISIAALAIIFLTSWIKRAEIYRGK